MHHNDKESSLSDKDYVLSDDVIFTDRGIAEELFFDIIVVDYFGKHNRDFDTGHFDLIEDRILSITQAELPPLKIALKIILTIDTISSQDILNLLDIDFTDLEKIHTFKDNLIIDRTLKNLFNHDNLAQKISLQMSYSNKKNLLNVLEIAKKTPELNTVSFIEKLILTTTPAFNSAQNEQAELKKRDRLHTREIAKHALPQPYDALNTDVLKQLDKYLSLKDLAVFSHASKSSYLLFKAKLDNKATLNAVVQGNPDALAIIVRNNPASIFYQGSVTAPGGQIIYDVSAYQLMTFLCDAAMKRQIMNEIQPFMTAELNTLLKKQDALISVGGADLVKINQDPSIFANVTEFNPASDLGTGYDLNSNSYKLKYSLLENTDGIIYYQNPAQTVTLYYANQITQTIELIDLQKISEQDQNNILAMFSDMEMNSSRRSSNQEHTLILNALNYKLIRKGIQYKCAGVQYCDNRIEFKLINAYRKHIRLIPTNLQGWVSEHATELKRQIHSAWMAVGHAQRQVIWILQRIYEPASSFNYTPSIYSITTLSEQQRAMINLINPNRKIPTSLLQNNHLDNALGMKFAIFRSKNEGQHSEMRQSSIDAHSSKFMLERINLLINDAKKDVRELSEAFAPKNNETMTCMKLSRG